MIYRIFSDKDTVITNYRRGNVAQTGSNVGASEILQVFKKTNVGASSSLGRTLISYNLSGISDLTASGDAPASGIRYYLKMYDAQHCGELPTSYDMTVQAVSQQWDEGKGHDLDNFTDKGVANWDKARTSLFWTQPGASGSGPISTFHFDLGHEDLEVDVTDIVTSWLSGTVTNNGFLIKLSSSYEEDTEDYYVKMFHGRQTFFKDKRPVIEARWDDSIRDDRNNFFFDVSGTLYMHHVVRGERTSLSGVGTGSIGVRIVDASGTIMTVTGSYAGKPGMYSASFVIPTGSYSGSVFHDIWFDLNSTSRSFVTGTFSVSDDLSSTDVTPKRYFVSMKNLKDSYERDEIARLSMYVRPHDYNPARVLTASFGATGTVVTRGYYRIMNDRTDEVVVPFGTGSNEFTRLSYDENGNFFNFHMSSLAEGNVYRITFLLYVDGQRQLIDGNHKFRVVR